MPCNFELQLKQAFFDKDGLTLNEAKTLQSQEGCGVENADINSDGFANDLFNFSADGRYGSSEIASLKNNPWVKYHDLDLTFLVDLNWLDHFGEVSQNWSDLSREDRSAYLECLEKIYKNPGDFEGNEKENFIQKSTKIAQHFLGFLNGNKIIFDDARKESLPEYYLIMNVLEGLVLLVPYSSEAEEGIKSFVGNGDPLDRQVRNAINFLASDPTHDSLVADLRVEVHLKIIQKASQEGIIPDPTQYRYSNGVMPSDHFNYSLVPNMEKLEVIRNIQEKIIRDSILEKYLNTQDPQRRKMLQNLYHDLNLSIGFIQPSDEGYKEYHKTKMTYSKLGNAESIKEVEDLWNKMKTAEQQKPEYSINFILYGDVAFYCHLSYRNRVKLAAGDSLGNQYKYFTKDLFNMGTYGLDPNSEEFKKVKNQFIETALSEINEFRFPFTSSFGSKNEPRSKELSTLLQVLKDVQTVAGSSKLLKKMWGQESIKEFKEKISHELDTSEGQALNNWLNENL